jgi:MOSC domain-containing protein YiiM
MQLLAISVGKIKNLIADTNAEVRMIPSAIDKQPMSTIELPVPITVRYLGLDQDEQADLRVHGGEEKAIYAYPSEHYEFWHDQRSIHGKNLQKLNFGAMGENFTTEGLTEESVFVGDQWRIGEVLLEVVKFREPCFKFNIKMGWSAAAKAMIQSGYSGWYLKVIQTGKVSAGDAIVVIPGERKLSIKKQSNQYYNLQSLL